MKENLFHLFYEDLIPGVLPYVSIFDLLLYCFYFLLLMTGLYFISNQKNKQDTPLLLTSVTFKIAMGTLFALFYVYYYNGGDTTAYWTVASDLNTLFYKDPGAYFNELWNSSEQSMNVFYNHGINSASWIVNEPDSFFIAKIASVFTLLSFGNFLTATLVFSFVVALVCWNFYLFLRQELGDSVLLKFGALFIPSVAFWCSGITKDTVVLVCILVLVPVLMKCLKTLKVTLKDLMLFVVFSAVLLGARPVIYYLVVAPIPIVLLLRLAAFFKRTPALKIIYQVSIIGAGIIVIMMGSTYLNIVRINDFLAEAQVVQNDFLQNTLYTGTKYDLGIIDFSMAGILKSAPEAVIAGIFRPFIWESFSPSLLLNGLEGLLFLYLFVKNFLFRFRKKMMEILNSEVLLYAMLFVLLMAFITGLTSVLFGVLVRLRAPLLPFLVLLFIKGIQQEKSVKQEQADSLI